MISKRKFPDPDGPARLREGHEGNPPVIERVRDIAGKGKRSIERTMKYDTIARLRKAKVITDVHVYAARRLEEDACRAEIITGTSPDGIRTVRTLYELSDAQSDSAARWADAREAVRKALGVAGSRGELLLRLVVIENRTLLQTAQMTRTPARAMGYLLRLALDVLARHYGYA